MPYSVWRNHECLGSSALGAQEHGRSFSHEFTPTATGAALGSIVQLCLSRASGAPVYQLRPSNAPQHQRADEQLNGLVFNGPMEPVAPDTVLELRDEEGTPVLTDVLQIISATDHLRSADEELGTWVLTVTLAEPETSAT